MPLDKKEFSILTKAIYNLEMTAKKDAGRSYNEMFVNINGLHSVLEEFSPGCKASLLCQVMAVL